MSRARRVLARARSHGRDERGSVLVLICVFMVAMIGTAGLVIDLAALRQNRAQDRKTADLVVTAAATNLATPVGTVKTACEAGWAYFRENVDDEGATVTAPPCSTAFVGECDPLTARTATGYAGDYTVQIINPVPDDHELMDEPDVVGGPAQVANEDIDGPPCERIGARILHDREHVFARVLGVDSATTDSHSVARPTASFTSPGVIALLLLDPDGCNVLTASGQAEISIQSNGRKPGYITLDTSALGGSGSHNCNSGSTYAVDALGTQNSKIIAKPSTESGLEGIIRMFALLPGNGTTKAYEPADVTAGRVSPRPTPASQRIGRDPVDWVYNCKQLGRDGIANTPDDCNFSDVRDPYIDELTTALGGTGTPAGYTRYPRSGEAEDTCSQEANNNNITLPPGNWFIDCPSGFVVKNQFRIVSGNVVFAGDVNAASQGSITINESNSDDSVIYIRSGGDLTKDAQSSIALNRSVVVLANGVISLGAGSGALVWSGPTEGNFKNLALWSESSALHELGGQSNLSVDGVFFAPNAAPFRFTGQAGQNQTNAQFIAYRMEVSGQGTLVMQPNPDRVVVLPAWGGALLR